MSMYSPMPFDVRGCPEGYGDTPIGYCDTCGTYSLRHREHGEWIRILRKHNGRSQTRPKGRTEPSVVAFRLRASARSLERMHQESRLVPFV